MQHRPSPVLPALAAALAGALAAATAAAPVGATDIRMMMDWSWQGPNAFALLARDRGCFRDAGLNVTLDRGFGSGRVPVELGAGTYEMGFADINPTIRFLAENPDQDVFATAILLGRSPLVAIVRADRGIATPADLVGRTLAAPEFDAGRQLFPLLAEAVGFDPAGVNWISVAPELREPMMIQGQADGITGFSTSTIPSIHALGMTDDQMTVFHFADFGVELYSSAILTTRRFADANPEAVAAATACLIEGFRQAVADPDALVAALVAHEPLTDAAVERGRWLMSVNDLVLTEETLANGLSTVDMDRLQRSITAVERVHGLEPRLTAAAVFDPAFLPPVEARMLLTD